MPEDRQSKRILEWIPPSKIRRGKPTTKWKTHVFRIMNDRNRNLTGGWNDCGDKRLTYNKKRSNIDGRSLRGTNLVVN